MKILKTLEKMPYGKRGLYLTRLGCTTAHVVRWKKKYGAVPEEK